ncbi:MAG: hypothetical protein K9G62_01205 [Alphaproteobacteria bacterium]|nr:hypothetical protein [Alphaproteobacteria bacterium]
MKIDTPLRILLVYETTEFGSSTMNALEKLHLSPPIALAERYILFNWLAGGRCSKKNEAIRTAKALHDLGHIPTLINVKDLSLSNNQEAALLCNGKPFNLTEYDGAWLRLSGRNDRSDLVTKVRGAQYFKIISCIERELPVVTPFNKLLLFDSKIQTQVFLEENDIPSPPSLILRSAEKKDTGMDRKIDSFIKSSERGSKFVLKKDYGAMGHNAPYKKKPTPWDTLQSNFRGLFIHDNPDLLKEKIDEWLNLEMNQGVVLQNFIEKGYRRERRVEVFTTPSGPKVLHVCERNGKHNIPLNAVNGIDLPAVFKAAQSAGAGRWGISEPIKKNRNQVFIDSAQNITAFEGVTGLDVEDMLNNGNLIAV